jgi:hypothetical protein
MIQSLVSSGQSAVSVFSEPADSKSDGLKGADAEIQNALTQECHNLDNLKKVMGPRVMVVFKISKATELLLTKHGSSLKTLNLCAHVLYKNPDWRLDATHEQMTISARWDSTLLCKQIFPQLKSLERLTLTEYPETELILSGLPASLRHLEIDAGLTPLHQWKRFGKKVSVTYSVDPKIRELQQYLFQLACKLIEGQEDPKEKESELYKYLYPSGKPVVKKASEGTGPNLQSLKITYGRDTVTKCLPALKKLEDKGLQLKFAETPEKCTLDIGIENAAIPVDDVFMKSIKLTCLDEGTMACAILR